MLHMKRKRPEWTYVYEMCAMSYTFIYTHTCSISKNVNNDSIWKQTFLSKMYKYILLKTRSHRRRHHLGETHQTGKDGGGNEWCDTKREKNIIYIYIVSINITIIAKHLNNIHSELSYDVTIINIKTTLYILSFGFRTILFVALFWSSALSSLSCFSLSLTVFQVAGFLLFFAVHFLFFGWLVCRCC